jgi:gamma-glutamyltranspeptidase/glutathione hydrolase
VEARFPPETVEGLSDLGHDVKTIPPWGGSGAVQLIMIHPESGALLAGSDPRCDGCAVGL